MSGLNNLKPQRVVKAFERTGCGRAFGGRISGAVSVEA